MADKRPFLVELEQTQRVSLVIMAESKEDAQADADELDVSGWEAEFVDVTIHEVDEIPDNVEVWSGGPDGDWVID
jgi:hypothetical protein